MRCLPFVFLLLLLSCSDDGIDWTLDEEPMEPWTYRNISDSIGRRYGVRWQKDNPNDLGERCLGATGLRARFGVGKSPGASDFDQLYPWSQIRRCNIRKEGDNTIIIFDDDPRFSTDGSNGDVFVRIPKFYVEKYEDEEYEYRVISATGQHPHPAFIEHGRELNAVYISAFEGYIGADSALQSVAGVIPTSNITAQQFLDAAQRRGSGYSLYDMRTVDMLYTLIAVEFGCRNTGIVFGHGIAYYRQPIEKEWDNLRHFYSSRNQQATNIFITRRRYNQIISIGSSICICKGDQRNILTFARCTNVKDHSNETYYYFDGPPIDIDTDCFIGNCAQVTNWTETCSAPHLSSTGRANMMEAEFLPRERNPMRYRWMENIVGNIWHYLPDITLYNQQLYQCCDMDEYVFGGHDGAYQAIGMPLRVNTDNGTQADERGRNCWVTSLMPDTVCRGIAIGDNYNRNLTSTQAFGAYYYAGSGLCIAVNGGGFDHVNRCNLLTTRLWDAPNIRWHLYGARLIFKDVKAQ